jgi:flagellar biosynthesis protein FlhG
MAEQEAPNSFDQAHRLRQMVAQRPAVQAPERQSTHVIAVASGKGGVGKTLVSVNLAIALAARGHRVILFDMDMGLANADIVLGVEPTCSWSDVLGGRRSFEEVIVRAPGDIAFVPGSSGVARLANLSEFERHHLTSAMARIESRYDVAVIDCGAGISRNVVGFGAAADTIMVVATPEPTAITDAYAMIKAFALDSDDGFYSREPGNSIGLLVNQVESRREARQTYERIAGVSARFLHLPVSDYGYVLRDDHVSSAVRERFPVVLRHPRCSATMCLMSTAARLSREIGAGENAKTRQGLFYRVMNMFV